MNMITKSTLILCSAATIAAFGSISLPFRRHHPSSTSWLASSSDPDELAHDGESPIDSSLEAVPLLEDFLDAVPMNDAESPDNAPSDVEEIEEEDEESDKKESKVIGSSSVNSTTAGDEKGSDHWPTTTSTTSPTLPSPSTVQATWMTLLQIAASTGRGEFATPLQKEQAASLIATLEAQNPTPEPATSPLALGRWELLYSSTQLFRSSPFFMAGRAVCSTPEQAKQYDWFCDMHRKALAISTIGQVRQILSPTRMVSEFEVTVGAVPFLSDFTPFKYSGGWPVSSTKCQAYVILPTVVLISYLLIDGLIE